MKHSEQIKEQIKKHYHDGISQYSDLAKHLKNDKIDRFEPVDCPICGFDESLDGSLIVFYFNDRSALVVNCCGMIAI